MDEKREQTAPPGEMASKPLDFHYYSHLQRAGIAADGSA